MAWRLKLGGGELLNPWQVHAGGRRPTSDRNARSAVQWQAWHSGPPFTDRALLWLSTTPGTGQPRDLWQHDTRCGHTMTGWHATGAAQPWYSAKRSGAFNFNGRSFQWLERHGSGHAQKDGAKRGRAWDKAMHGDLKLRLAFNYLQKCWHRGRMGSNLTS